MMAFAPKTDGAEILKDIPEPPHPALRKLPANCISTSDSPAGSREEAVEVVIESPLVIDVEGAASYTILCTPTDKRFLTMGFLFSEGVINSLDEVVLLRECEDAPGVIRVKLKGEPAGANYLPTGRNLMVVSSCGACGTEEFAQKLETLPQVGNSLRIPGSLLRMGVNELSRNQPLFRTCGGTHWAGIFNADGKLLAYAEDTGRHNALDKAIGKCLLSGVSVRGCWATLSGRVSFEMVSKCARVGIELISAISAPTSLAVETAEHCGITLCAFVRETRATVFTHSERVICLNAKY